VMALSESERLSMKAVTCVQNILINPHQLCLLYPYFDCQGLSLQLPSAASSLSTDILTKTINSRSLLSLRIQSQTTNLSRYRFESDGIQNGIQLPSSRVLLSQRWRLP